MQTSRLIRRRKKKPSCLFHFPTFIHRHQEICKYFITHITRPENQGIWIISSSSPWLIYSQRCTYEANGTSGK